MNAARNASQNPIAAAVLAGVDVATFEFQIGGRGWGIRAARDHASLLGIADRFSEFPFGLLLWESSPVLAEALVERADRVRGARVLELGCGVGFPGIVARWLGAATVRQTDHVAEALDLARANAAANGVADIETELADWAQWASAADGKTPDDKTWDLVIGSDVLYDRAAQVPFAELLARCLAPGGRVLITDPGRQDTPAFVAAMSDAGWQVAVSRRTTPALLPGGADIVAVDVFELTKG